MKKGNPRSPRTFPPETTVRGYQGVQDGMPHFWWLVLAGIVMVLAFRPIAADGVWWELSRGREVLRGSFTPSRNLLTLDATREADWLGGVPMFLAYSLAGGSGLMLLRIAAVMGLACLVGYGARGSHPAILAVLLLAGLLGTERALDIGPSMFDVLGIAVVFQFANRLRAQETFGDDCGEVGRPAPNRHESLELKATLALALLFAAWSNVGPRVVLGWFVLASCLLATTASASRRSLRSSFAWLLVAGVAMCLTPRGVLTIRDSLHMVFPQFATDAWALVNTAWQPLLWSAWGRTEMVFLGLSVLLVAIWIALRLDRELGVTVACFTAQLLPWISVGNLEQASVWLVFLIGGIVRDSQLASNRVTELPRFVGPGSRVVAPSVALLGAVLLIIVSGPRALIADMGWGLHSKLDNRLLGLVLSSLEPHGTAFADTVRSAGMVCWHAPAELQVQDEPQRALLGGRWRQQQLLHADLRLERQSSYWRDDGSEGGWWVPLFQLRTSLVVVEAGNTALIRALEPTIWKPLSLDSTVLPYAAAGDRVYNDMLVETLRQREFVDVGSWTYSPPPFTNSDFDRDRCGWRPKFVDPADTLRQARAFRAMQLLQAALKVLLATQEHLPASDFYLEFAMCQRELVHREAVIAGRPSQFRRLALREALRRTGRPLRVDAKLLERSTPGEGNWLQAIDRYLSGDLSGAMQALTSDRPEETYGAACLAIESGRLPEARALLRRDEKVQTDRSLALLIAARLQELDEEP